MYEHPITGWTRFIEDLVCSRGFVVAIAFSALLVGRLLERSAMGKGPPVHRYGILMQMLERH